MTIRDRNLLTVEQIRLIANKRRNAIALTCIFCHKHIGWYTIEEIIARVAAEKGIVSCQECAIKYEKHY